MTLIVERKRKVDDRADAAAQRGLDERNALSAKAKADKLATAFVERVKGSCAEGEWPAMRKALLSILSREKPVRAMRPAPAPTPADEAKALREKVFSGGARG